MRKSLERLLAAHGYRTEAYPSAESFLARTASLAINCMVIDIHLGGMNGIQLRRHLSASEPDLGVIFITAVDDDLLEIDAGNAGCAAYLRKPFSASLLLDAIEKATAD